jgi:hypothetical protein
MNWRGGGGRGHYCLTSVAFPHNNCCAEVGVKTVNCMTMDNTNHIGDLDMNKFKKSVLQPDTDTKLSPKENIFDCPIRDFIPILPGKYQPTTRRVTY